MEKIDIGKLYTCVSFKFVTFRSKAETSTKYVTEDNKTYMQEKKKIHEVNYFNVFFGKSTSKNGVSYIGISLGPFFQDNKNGKNELI